uniref:DUF6598 domain-containing protein n=1 Tax=Oryza glumipatula TaxID=40148 RepID=A0A0E0BQK6_9ORYZ
MVVQRATRFTYRLRMLHRAITRLRMLRLLGAIALLMKMSGIHTHRDGTIYKNERYWDSVFCIDVTNREETNNSTNVIFSEAQVEPVRFSVTERCKPNPENCQYYSTCGMMQVFSLKLAKTTTNSSPIQLYGYIAARDVVDSMLNYVFNRSRDDPIVVRQGSIIELTGPKRGIGMVADVIFEFDMRIKNGEKEEDDLQLIDGIIEIDDNVVTMIGTPRTFRLSGDCGSVDMSMAIFDNAVEATVEVAISELHYGFDLSISYVLSELEGNIENFSFSVVLLVSRVA